MDRLDQKRLPQACRPVGPIGPRTQAVGYHGGKGRRLFGPMNSERCLVVARIDSHTSGSRPRHGNVAFSGPRNERRRVQKRSRLPLRTDPKSCRSADPRVPHRRCSNVSVRRTKRTSAAAVPSAANTGRRSQFRKSLYPRQRQMLENTDKSGVLTLTDLVMWLNLLHERLNLIAASAKRWMPREDSNLNRRYQKPQSYH